MYLKHGDTNLPFTDAMVKMFSDVRKTLTKQFIYIQILDKNLHSASDILPYPKPSNEYPIKTKEVILKENMEVYNNPIKRNQTKPEFK